MMIYKELSGTINLAGEELERIVGGTSPNSSSAWEQFKLAHDEYFDCKNTEKCYETTGDHGLGHAYELHQLNPGQVNQQDIVFDPSM